MKLYTIGYSGRSIEELQSIVWAKNGILLDIRYSARSRRPEFSHKRLLERFGEWYNHVPEWGNLNYRASGAIEIADFDGGMNTVMRFIEDYRASTGWPGDVFLMCACADPNTCHRSIVASLLREHGYTVTEWQD